MFFMQLFTKAGIRTQQVSCNVCSNSSKCQYKLSYRQIWELSKHNAFSIKCNYYKEQYKDKMFKGGYSNG